MEEKIKSQRQILTPAEKLKKAIDVRVQKARAVDKAREDLRKHDELIIKLRNQITQNAFQDVDDTDLLAFSKILGKPLLIKLVMEGNYEELEKLRQQVNAN